MSGGTTTELALSKPSAIKARARPLCRDAVFGVICAVVVGVLTFTVSPRFTACSRAVV